MDDKKHLISWLHKPLDCLIPSGTRGKNGVLYDLTMSITLGDCVARIEYDNSLREKTQLS